MLVKILIFATNVGVKQKRLNGPRMEPNNLDIKGRSLSKEEQKRLYQYFNGMDYLAKTMNIVRGNIEAAQDEEAASIWVQWILNAALSDFDSIMAALKEE